MSLPPLSGQSGGRVKLVKDGIPSKFGNVDDAVLDYDAVNKKQLDEVDDKITQIENNEYKVFYFENIDISASTSGSITIPTGATIQENEFGLSGNAVLSTVTGSNKPTYESPLDGSDVPITASLDTAGNYIATNTYPSTVSLIYALTIKAVDFQNLTEENIIGFELNPEEDFTDNLFRIRDNLDSTKQLGYVLDNLSTLTTRFITVRDRDFYTGAQHTKTVHVASWGDDTLDGLSPDQPVLTLGRAIIVATALSPSSSNIICIEISDYDFLSENVTLPSWVNIYAECTDFGGTINVGDNSVICFRILIKSVGGSCIFKNTGTGSSSIHIKSMNITGTALGIVSIVGKMDIFGSDPFIVEDSAIGVATAAATGVIHMIYNHFNLDNGGTGISNFAGGEVEMIGVGAEGDGTFIDNLGAGFIYSNKSHLDCTTHVNNISGVVTMYIAQPIGPSVSAGVITGGGITRYKCAIPDYGECYFQNNAFGTIIGSIGTYTDINGITSAVAGNTLHFTHSNGELTWVGPGSKTFHIQGYVLMSSGTAGVDVRAAIFTDRGSGWSLQTDSENASSILTVNSHRVIIPVDCILTITNGTKAKIRIANDTSATGLTVEWYKLTLTEV